MPTATLDSPLGRLVVHEEEGAIVALTWTDNDSAVTQDDTELLREARRQLTDYFAGRRQSFDLPLRPAGSVFQRRVYAAMSAIPFGETRSYGAIAQETGSIARAVGGACGSNPIPVIIPCHRVVASGGRLGGFSAPGGRDSKRRLLALEQSFANRAQDFRLTSG